MIFKTFIYFVSVWKVRGQLMAVGSLLPPCRFWGSNSGCQDWWQALIPANPSTRPCVCSNLEGLAVQLVSLNEHPYKHELH